MLTFISLSVDMMSVFMLSIIMPSVISAQWHYPECHYAECRGTIEEVFIIVTHDCDWMKLRMLLLPMRLQLQQDEETIL